MDLLALDDDSAKSTESEGTTDLAKREAEVTKEIDSFFSEGLDKDNNLSKETNKEVSENSHGNDVVKKNICYSYQEIG